MCPRSHEMLSSCIIKYNSTITLTVTTLQTLCFRSGGPRRTMCEAPTSPGECSRYEEFCLMSMYERWPPRSLCTLPYVSLGALFYMASPLLIKVNTVRASVLPFMTVVLLSVIMTLAFFSVSLLEYVLLMIQSSRHIHVVFCRDADTNVYGKGHY